MLLRRRSQTVDESSKFVLAAVRYLPQCPSRLWNTAANKTFWKHTASSRLWERRCKGSFRPALASEQLKVNRPCRRVKLLQQAVEHRCWSFCRPNQQISIPSLQIRTTPCVPRKSRNNFMLLDGVFLAVRSPSHGTSGSSKNPFARTSL